MLYTFGPYHRPEALVYCSPNSLPLPLLPYLPLSTPPPPHTTPHNITLHLTTHHYTISLPRYTLPAHLTPTPHHIALYNTNPHPTPHPTTLHYTTQYTTQYTTLNYTPNHPTPTHPTPFFPYTPAKMQAAPCYRRWCSAVSWASSCITARRREGCCTALRRSWGLRCRRHLPKARPARRRSSSCPPSSRYGVSCHIV